jgi:hypothetical protein
MAPPVAPPVSIFPPPRQLAFPKDADTALQPAVSAAVTELIAARNKPIPFSLAIIDLGDGSSTGTLKWGAHKPNEEHYVASAAKVGALYAAFALRDMVRRFAIVAKVADVFRTIGTKQPVKPLPLFDTLRQMMDPAIDAGANHTLSAAVQREHRVPHYEQVLNEPPPGTAIIPDFTGSFLNSMKLMIVPSDNAGAGRCIRGVGYGYLNGALAKAGLFDVTDGTGVWLAGDFVGVWPYARIHSVNDAAVAQAGSALAMAKLLALIVNRGVLDANDCNDMRKLLADATQGPDLPFLTRPAVSEALRLPLTKVTHAKLGFGPLKKGGNVCSEMFRLEGIRRPDRSYGVAFQNLNEQESSLDDVAFVLRRAIELYER